MDSLRTELAFSWANRLHEQFVFGLSSSGVISTLAR